MITVRALLVASFNCASDENRVVTVDRLELASLHWQNNINSKLGLAQAICRNLTLTCISIMCTCTYQYVSPPCRPRYSSRCAELVTNSRQKSEVYFGVNFLGKPEQCAVKTT